MSVLGVVGAGAWGTALAFQLARANPASTIYLWGYDPEQQREMLREGRNHYNFPNYPFPANLQAVVDLAEVAQASALIIAVPSHAFSTVIEKLIVQHQFHGPMLSATKGLEPTTGDLLHTVVQRFGGEHFPFSILSGPSFANEVMAQLPTAVTIGAAELAHAKVWQQYLHNDAFRVYTTTDIIGVQLGGAVKNVLAIATGIADGLGYGANARAALITRGLAEMQRLNQSLGGKNTTLMGLAGLGDLVLTCTDNQSRNRRFGLAIGAGKSIEETKAESNQVVEGYQTAKLLHQLLQQHPVEMPICNAVYHILYKGSSVKEVIQTLMSRAPKGE